MKKMRLALTVVLLWAVVGVGNDEAEAVGPGGKPAGWQMVASPQVRGTDIEKTIFLKSRTFKPGKGIDPALNLAALPARAHLFIQFDRVLNAEEAEQLAILNVSLHDYVHYNAWSASIDRGKLAKVKKLAFVRWIGPIQKDDKIAPRLKTGVPEWARNEDGSVKLIVRFFADVSPQEAAAVLEDVGATSYDGPFMLNDYSVRADEAGLAALANEDSVQLTESGPPPEEAFNDGARAAVNADPVQDAPYNLSGNGVKVGMWDLDKPDETHDDLVGRITHIESAGVGDHSTLVSGTLGGNGSSSLGWWRGIAPMIAFFTYSTVEDDQEPEEHDGAINTQGIDISTNSWGVPSLLGDYTLRSQKYDNIVKGTYGRRIPLIFSAGNEQLETGDGFQTVAAPGATGKNTISVGAIKSDDDSIATYATWGSSFGPTDDGRIKPDLAAPGCESTGTTHYTRFCLKSRCFADIPNGNDTCR